jgi:hypothetical protein
MKRDKYFHVYVCDYTIFGLLNRFIDQLHTPLLTTSNYIVIDNLNSLQINTACAKSSQFAFTSRFLVMDHNNEDSSASVFTSLLFGEYPTTELTL